VRDAPGVLGEVFIGAGVEASGQGRQRNNWRWWGGSMVVGYGERKWEWQRWLMEGKGGIGGSALPGVGERRESLVGASRGGDGRWGAFNGFRYGRQRDSGCRFRGGGEATWTARLLGWGAWHGGAPTCGGQPRWVAAVLSQEEDDGADGPKSDQAAEKIENYF
jgi:hypothetical protein